MAARGGKRGARTWHAGAAGGRADSHRDPASGGRDPGAGEPLFRLAGGRSAGAAASPAVPARKEGRASRSIRKPQPASPPPCPRSPTTSSARRLRGSGLRSNPRGSGLTLFTSPKRGKADLREQIGWGSRTTPSPTLRLTGSRACPSSALLCASRASPTCAGGSEMAAPIRAFLPQLPFPYSDRAARTRSLEE